MSFEYNSSGLRTKKVVGDKTTEFYYSGNLLVAQYDGTHWIKFIYAPDGEVVGFTIHDDLGYYDYCYYLKNIQGDIIGIYSNISQLFREYTYDAWGNVTGVTDFSGNEITDPEDIGHRNPLRYRGYYYDTETELYYLNSRYYNPEWGTFISADDVVSGTGEAVSGYNLYSYCFNNPIMFKDIDGHFPWLVVIAIGICSIAGLVLGATYQKDLSQTAREQVGHNNNSSTNKNNDMTSNNSASNSDSELTAKQRVKNAAIGFSLGLATGGAIATIVGAGIVVMTGCAATYVTLLGGTAAQIFAIGALSFDAVALIVLPIFGIEMEPIEYASSQSLV